MLRRILWCGVLSLAACSLSAIVPSRAHAQGGVAGLAGVHVDADGVLRVQVATDPTGALTKQRIEAARAGLKPQLVAKSALRKVSLNRLEEAVAARLAAGQEPTDEMKYLAGLMRAQFVFFYPDTNDIVLAGPAEGWYTDLTGRVRGINSGRPVIELQDLIVALRMFAPGRSHETIGCSIDPTPEGLVAMKAYLKTLGSTISPDADTAAIARNLKNSLGPHKVRVLGISPDTHFAQVLVEADYRMKLIGIGIEPPPVKMNTYVAQARPGSANAMQRWFFTPDYECIRASEDQLAMELVGEGVKLVGADEIVGADGTRSKSSKVDKASRAYTVSFTKEFPKIAAISPVYAQLRNLIDLSVAAAFIQRQEYQAKANWKMETFLHEEQYPVETYQTPVMVEAAVNAFFKGGQFMMPIGGGVHIRVDHALEADNMLSDKEGAVSQRREQVKADDLAAGQWWWD